MNTGKVETRPAEAVNNKTTAPTLRAPSTRRTGMRSHFHSSYRWNTIETGWMSSLREACAAGAPWKIQAAPISPWVALVAFPQPASSNTKSLRRRRINLSVAAFILRRNAATSGPPLNHQSLPPQYDFRHTCTIPHTCLHTPHGRYLHLQALEMWALNVFVDETRPLWQVHVNFGFDSFYAFT